MVSESSDDSVHLIRQAISDQRLDAYRITEADDDLDLLERYVWNMALSEALYPVLQSLEVTLRNTVHRAIGNAVGTDTWFDAGLLAEPEVRQIAEARAKLAVKRKPDEPDRVVAELNFGFWTSLFNDRYEHVLWRSNPKIGDAGKLIKTAFPNLEPRLRTRAKIGARVNTIRQRLRNRIFHHEPIWNMHSLPALHVELHAILGWINPAMLELVKRIDRFPEVYGQGSRPYRKRLSGVLDKS